MKQIFLLLIVFTTVACNNNDKDVFLESFIQIDEFPTEVFFIKNNIIKENDTIPRSVLTNKFLIPVNDRFSSKNLLKRYYYCGKYFLDESYCIVCYRIFYDYHESKTIISIYNTREKVITSSLEVMSSDLSLSRSSYYKNGIIYIVNRYKKGNNLDSDNPQKNNLTEETEKYIINKSFLFERIR